MIIKLNTARDYDSYYIFFNRAVSSFYIGGINQGINKVLITRWEDNSYFNKYGSHFTKLQATLSAGDTWTSSDNYDDNNLELQVSVESIGNRARVKITSSSPSPSALPSVAPTSSPPSVSPSVAPTSSTRPSALPSVAPTSSPPSASPSEHHCPIENLYGTSYRALDTNGKWCYQLSLDATSSTIYQDLSQKNCADPFIKHKYVGSSSSSVSYGLNTFVNGEVCNNGVARSATVNISYSSDIETPQMSVSEPSTCQYEADLLLPLECPTPAPTPSCVDSSTAFKMQRRDGSYAWKTCEWAAANPDRCLVAGVARSCPAACGTCEKCIDSPYKFQIRFYVQGNLAHTLRKKCPWVLDSFTGYRCSLNGVAEACREACGICSSNKN